jgi:hypothetical protein
MERKLQNGILRLWIPLIRGYLLGKEESEEERDPDREELGFY